MENSILIPLCTEVLKIRPQKMQSGNVKNIKIAKKPIKDLIYKYKNRLDIEKIKLIGNFKMSRLTIRAACNVQKYKRTN